MAIIRSIIICQKSLPRKGGLFAFWRAAGFTLVELVVVLILLGILSVYAMPRMINTGDINALGFHNETLGYLRFAQKIAIAQRRTVCVGFTTSSVTLTISSSSATFDCAVAGGLKGPKGESAPVTLNARSGVTFAALPVAFNFDGLGQPINSTGALVASQTFQVSGVSRSITVESSTGYVHD